MEGGASGDEARPRGARPLAAAVAVAAAGTLAAGIGVAATRAGGPTRAAEPALPDGRAVATLLESRSRAVRERDRAAFLDTVRGGPAAVRAAQAALFDDLGRLPLASWREEPAASPPARAAGGDVTIGVTLRYRLRGHDAAPAARDRRMTIARGPDGGWTVTGEEPAGAPDIWDGGRLSVVRGRHSLVIAASPVRPGLPREVARRLDAAVPKVRAMIGGAGGRAARPVALVPADGARAAALAGDRSDVQDIAALATAVPSRDGSGRGADRIVISPGTFGRLNALGRRVILAHELTHVATGAPADRRTPPWLVEGLADYVGYRGERVTVRSAARELRAGPPPVRLPSGDDFAGPPGRSPRAYEGAWLACRMVAGRYGEAGLLRLYRAAGRMSEEAALRGALGVGRARFTGQWRDYLREELR